MRQIGASLAARHSRFSAAVPGRFFAFVGKAGRSQVFIAKSKALAELGCRRRTGLRMRLKS